MKLGPAELARFLEDGYLVVEGLLSPEQLEALRRDTAPLHESMAASAPDPAVRLSWEPTPPGEPRRLQQVLNAEVVSPTLHALVRSQPVLEVAEALIGPDLALFETKFLMKASRLGGEIPWHQDFAYWVQLTDAPHQISCLVAIDDADEENGCLMVIPGSHRQGLLPHRVNARTFSRTLPDELVDRAKAVTLPTKGGTGVIFGPFMVHGSGPNRSPRERRSMTMVFTAAGLGVPQRELLRERPSRAPEGWLPASLPMFVGKGPHGGQCQSNYRRRELWKLAASRVADAARPWLEVDCGAGDSLEWFAARKPAATPLWRRERVLHSRSNRDDVRVVGSLAGVDLASPLGLLHVDGEVYGDLHEPLAEAARRVGEGTVIVLDDALDAQGRPTAAADALHAALATQPLPLKWIARADRAALGVLSAAEVAPAAWTPTVSEIQLSPRPAPPPPPPPPPHLLEKLGDRVHQVLVRRVWPRLAAPGLESFFPVDEIPHVTGPGPRWGHCATHARRRELWRAAIALIADPTLAWCEFGVGEGESLDWWSLHKPREAPLLGFDWFEGIPEAWHTHAAGQWKSAEYVPNRPDLTIVRGLFEKTLSDPAVLSRLGRQIGLLHVDCDLYSSTKTILTSLSSRLLPGTVIIFDELYGYPAWHDHEIRAFRNHAESARWNFEYIGRADYQVAVRILSVGERHAVSVRLAPAHAMPPGLTFAVEPRRTLASRVKRLFGR